MGAWGTAIFSDDTACDIRDDYKELIGNGFTSEEATEKLISDYADVLEDEEEETVFWLALASVQWKSGRLIDRIKDKALYIIDNDIDLKRWQSDRKELTKRKSVLLKLKDELISPQPPAKKIPKRFKANCEFSIKDAVSYKLLSGKYVILKVIALITDKGGTYPLFEVCNWIGEEIPSIEIINNIQPISERQSGKLAIGAVSKQEYPKDRLSVIAENVKTNFSGNVPYNLILWREVDEKFERYYGFR